MSPAADPGTCAICRRHFLQGEAVRLYRDPAGPNFRRVCALCLDTAATRGWEASEATREEPMRVYADPARSEVAMTRDRLVERLQHELEAVQRQLAGAKGSITEVQSRAVALERDRDGLASLPARLREAERERDTLAGEVDRLSQALAQAVLSERRLERAERRVKEVEAELVDAQVETERLRSIRRREADPAYLRGIAALAFNRSSHAGVIANVARRRGDPRCRLAPEGVALPRQVRATFFWDDAWFEFVIALDIAERSVRVDEVGRGDSSADLPASRLRENAAWTPGNGLIADPLGR